MTSNGAARGAEESAVAAGVFDEGGDGPLFRVFDGGFDAAECAPRRGQHLHPQVQRWYGGDWVVPDTSERPYVYSNFVISHDGRISFGEPGRSTGYAVSMNSRHDRWIMALTRSRADAVLIGDGILRGDPDFRCGADYVWSVAEGLDVEAFRRVDGRRSKYLCIIVSFEMDFPAVCAILTDPEVDVLVATTDRGLSRVAARDQAKWTGVQVRSFGAESVDLAQVLREAHNELRVRTVLCEGGALLYGSMLQAGLIDDEFLTLSPLMIGPPRNPAHRRPTVVDGTDFTSDRHPVSRLVSVRAAGSHLFLHSTYRT
jgi:riboflavin biosynthesis pyrimidine reductase